MEVRGRVALVTGAASGIGRAIAELLAREGAAVVVEDLDDAGRDLARRIEAGGGRAAFFRGDVASETDSRRMIEFAVESFGGLDVLVNNAGVYIHPPFFPDASIERWNRIVDVYLRGVLLGIHFAVPALRKRGGGAIVNVSSLAGIGFGPHGSPEYAACKAGVARLTAALAPLGEKDGIRINCVCPGWVDTPASRRTLAEMTPEERERVAPAVLLRPEAIADAALALILDDRLSGRVLLMPEGGPSRLVALEKSD